MIATLMINNLYSTKPFDLSRLLGEAFYKIHSPQQTDDFLNPYLGDFKIEWSNNQASIVMHKLSVGSINILGMAFDAQTRVHQANISQRHFIAFIIPIQLQIDANVDGNELSVPTFGTFMVSTEDQLTLDCPPLAQQLVVHIPFDLLNSLNTELFPNTCLIRSELNPSALLNHHQLGCFNALLGQALFIHTCPLTAPSQREWVRQIERGFALLTLESLLPSNSQLKSIPSTRSYNKPQLKTLEKLEAYMLSHLETPLTINDLIVEASCSRSRLFSLCQQQLGLSPMAWLRKLRLNAAQEYLMKHPHAPITAVAYRFGFSHLGRFAKYYQCQFGELPHKIRRRAS